MRGQGRRKLTDGDLDVIAEMRERGKSCAQIQRAFAAKGREISIGAISWQCLRLGVDPPGARPITALNIGPAVVVRSGHVVRRFSADEDARLIALEGEGLPVNRIATMIGRRPNSVRGPLLTLSRHAARLERQHG